MNRGLFRTAACVLLCVALALVGGVVALRAAAPESRTVTLGTVDGASRSDIAEITLKAAE